MKNIIIISIIIAILIICSISSSVYYILRPVENIFDLMKGLWIGESKNQFMYVKKAEDNTLWILYNIGSVERGLRVKSDEPLTSDGNITNNQVIFKPIEEYLQTSSNLNPKITSIQNQSNYPEFHYARSSNKLEMIFNNISTSYVKANIKIPTEQLLKLNGGWILQSDKTVTNINIINDTLARINGFLTRIQFENNALTYKDNMKIKQIVYNSNDTINIDGQIGTRKM